MKDIVGDKLSKRVRGNQQKYVYEIWQWVVAESGMQIFVSEILRL